MFGTTLGWLAIAFLLLGCGESVDEGPKGSASPGQGNAAGRAGGGGAGAAGGSASRAGNAGSGGRDAAATLCTSTRGTVGTGDCCLTAPDFPDTCVLGACGCEGTGSTHRVELCECPVGTCYDTTTGCI